jgi:hypothetical protein
MHMSRKGGEEIGGEGGGGCTFPFSDEIINPIPSRTVFRVGKGGRCKMRLFEAQKTGCDRIRFISFIVFRMH